MSLPRQQAKQRPVLDLVSVSLIVLAILIFGFSCTYLESEAYRASVVAIILAIVGFSLAVTLCGVKFDLRFSMREMSDTLSWTTVAVGAILIINRVVPFGLSVSPMPENVFAILMGVGEELFFRVFLCTWFTLMVGKWLGIFSSSLVFMTYHFSIYGGSLRALLVVFACGCMLGYTFIQSRRASVVMLPHALINGISYLFSVAR